MHETIIRLQVQRLEEGGFVGTSTDVPGLIVEADSIVELVQTAQGLVRCLLESYQEHGDPVPPALLRRCGETEDLLIPVTVG